MNDDERLTDEELYNQINEKTNHAQLHIEGLPPTI